MRTSSLVTVSLPPSLVKVTEKEAKRMHMTRSEFMRTALRRFLEEESAKIAIAAYKKERRERSLKTLKRGALGHKNINAPRLE